MNEEVHMATATKNGVLFLMSYDITLSYHTCRGRLQKESSDGLAEFSGDSLEYHNDEGKLTLKVILTNTDKIQGTYTYTFNHCGTYSGTYTADLQQQTKHFFKTLI